MDSRSLLHNQVELTEPQVAVVVGNSHLAAAAAAAGTSWQN